MKNNILILMIGVFVVQTQNTANGQETFTTLKTSKLAHTFTNEGFVKWSFDFQDQYSPDNNSVGFDLGYASGLLITGTDQDGEIQTSVNYYGSENYIPGVLSSATGEPIPENDDYFNRIWTISSEDVNYVQARFEDGTLSEADLPEDILEWPAIGNPYFGYNIIEQLAPFYDHDADSIYDPLKGDLPIVMDELEASFIPSKFTFCVYYNNINRLTNGDHHTLEIAQMNYILDCMENELQNSVFTRIRVTNKNNTDLQNTKLGFFKDFDLGCFEDDNFGTHTASQSVYAYNKAGQDLNPCSFGQNSISSDASAIYSTISLSHPLFSSLPTYYNNPEVPEPVLTTDFHNLLNGQFGDGTPMTFGGDGYDPGSNNETNFVFPDFPNDPIGWHMNNNPQLNAHLLVFSVDLGTLAPGQSETADFADVLLPFDKTDFSIFDDYENRINALKSLFEMATDSENTGLDCFSFMRCEEDCVWPGDVNDNGRVEADDAVYLASMAGDLVPNAQIRNKISSEWQAFSSTSWQAEKAGIDYKYGDVNGNGEVNNWDLQLLFENFRHQNNSYQKQSDVLPPEDSNGIGIEIDNDEINVDGSFFETLARVKITLGGPDFSLSEPVMALSFDLLIDTNLVFFSPWFNNDGNAFDRQQNYYEEEDPEIRPISNIINYSERQSHVLYQFDEPITEGGILIEDITIACHNLGKTNNPDGQEYTKIEVANIVALNKEGNPVDIGVKFMDSVLVTNLVYDPSSNVEDKEFLNAKVYPNPSSDELNINLNHIDKGRVQIRNIQGQKLWEIPFTTKEFTIQTINWDRGIYILQIIGQHGSFSKKIIKI